MPSYRVRVYEPKPGQVTGGQTWYLYHQFLSERHIFWYTVQFILSKCCHKPSDFKAKMHQIRFRLGLRLQRYPRPLAGFKGPP